MQLKLYHATKIIIVLQKPYGQITWLDRLVMLIKNIYNL